MRSRCMSMKTAKGRFAGALVLAGFTVLAPMGQRASAQGIPLIRDSEIESLLNDYAKPIFRAAGLGSSRITMRIVKNDNFNAFVLDGRNVFVHTGTLMTGEVAQRSDRRYRARDGTHRRRTHGCPARPHRKGSDARVADPDHRHRRDGGGRRGRRRWRTRRHERRPGRSARRQRRHHARAAVGAPFTGERGRSGRPAVPQRHQAIRPRHARDLRTLPAAGIHFRRSTRTRSCAATLSRPTVLRACAIW